MLAKEEDFLDEHQAALLIISDCLQYHGRDAYSLRDD